MTPAEPLDPIGSGRLAVPFTSFLGREREIGALLGLLTDDGARLVTLTGPGGVGKTRLAAEIGRRVDRAALGAVVFVPLDGVTDPNLVPTSIARAMGSREVPDQAPGEHLARTIGDRQMILVLDNFEQVLGAAGDMARLLSRCPRLTILVTSRAPLHLSGEFEFPLPPLEVPADWPDGPPPTPEAILASEVGALFVDRARAVRPDFALTPENAAAVAEVCRRLDGLPLAIELAAARTKVLSPAALAARVGNRLQLLTRGARDLPLRHQTMRDAIAWSYDLLGAEEQTLFRRLSVFAGGFTLDAAEAVSRGVAESRSRGVENPWALVEILPLDLLDAIAALVDNSLLRADETSEDERRFRMLEVVREFAWELAERHGELAEARRLHAHWYLDFAARVEGGFFRDDEPVWLERLEQELPNLRAALTWADEARETSLGLRAMGSLWWFWVAGGHVGEGRRLVETLLANADVATPRATLARAYETAGLVAWSALLLDEADARFLQALAIFREDGDPAGVMRSLHWRSLVARYQGDLDETTALATEALAAARALDEPVWIGNALGHLGFAAYRRGELAEGRVFLGEAIATIRLSGYKRGLAWALQLLADLEASGGDYVEAAALQRESLALNRAVADNWGLYEDLYSLGIIARGTGRAPRAATMLGAAARLREHAGIVPRVDAATFDATVAAVATAMSSDAFAAAWDAGRALSLAEALTAAETLAERIATEPPSPDVPRRHIDPGATTSASSPGGRGILTKRESDVLALLAEGRSDRDIAEALSISPKTAGNHVTNILGKLGVGSRAAAVARALRTGMI